MNKVFFLKSSVWLPLMFIPLFCYAQHSIGIGINVQSSQFLWEKNARGFSSGLMYSYQPVKRFSVETNLLLNFQKGLPICDSIEVLGDSHIKCFSSSKESLYFIKMPLILKGHIVETSKVTIDIGGGIQWNHFLLSRSSKRGFASYDTNTYSYLATSGFRWKFLPNWAIGGQLRFEQLIGNMGRAYQTSTYRTWGGFIGIQFIL